MQARLRSLITIPILLLVGGVGPLVGQIHMECSIGSSAEDHGWLALAGEELIFTGYVDDPSLGRGRDILFLRTDLGGEILQIKTFGSSQDDWPMALLPVRGGGFFVAGRTYGYGAGDLEMFTARLGMDGRILSFHTYGGPADDYCRGAISLADGNFLLTGSTRNAGLGSEDLMILKVSDQGALIWSRVFGDWNFETSYAAVEWPSGRIGIIGYSNSWSPNGFTDIVILCLDKYGDLVWSRSYGGSGHDKITDMDAAVVDQNGHLWVGAFRQEYGLGGYDMLLFKVSETGELLEELVIATPLDEVPRSLQILEDHSILVCGSMDSPAGQQRQGYLARVSSNGTLQWETLLGGSGWEVLGNVRRGAQNTLFLSGYTTSYGQGDKDLYLIRTGMEGGACETEFVESTLINPGISAYDSPSPVQAVSAMEVTSQDLVEVVEEEVEFVSEVICADTLVPGPSRLHMKPGINLQQGYPNPFNPELTVPFDLETASEVQLVVFDLQGRKILVLAQGVRDRGYHEVRWDGRDARGRPVAAGVYEIRLITPDQQRTIHVVHLD